jgi:NADPH:quinone reductase
MDWLLGHVAAGRLSAHIHAVYPLAETPEALRVIAARKVKGKILVRP